MKLFILRHGEAEAMMSRDEERQLTDRGRADVDRVIASRAQELSVVERVLVSPYIRAQQTADIVEKHLEGTPRHTTPYLVPESNPIELIRWLSTQCFGDLELNAILLVSHQPLVGTLVNELSGDPMGMHSMGTANLASLDAEVLAYGLAELNWLVRPGDLA